VAIWVATGGSCRPPPAALCRRHAIDDSALRSAAADLIATAKREVPMIGLALHAVERGLGTLAVEV